MTTPENTTTPDIVATENTAEAGSSSNNPFLTTDETHDRAISLVLDTSPFLRGGASKLRALADKFYTIPEVLNEIRDKQARKDLDMLPFEYDHFLWFAAFARKTGDSAVLSATDLRVLALTYQLEFENCGMKRIRAEPVRANVQPTGNRPPATPRRTKNSAKEITGDFEDEEPITTAEDSQQQEQGNTVLEEEEESDEEEEEAAAAEDQDVQDISGKLENLTTMEGKTESAEQKETKDASESTPAATEENNEDDDDDGEWITPENVKKFKRHGTLKPKKKVRKTLLMQVACTTADYAMQNVLLQMGLNLLSIDGLRISKVKNWVLRCHACTKVTHDMEKKFCPSCGNSTLMRTSTSTDQNGNVKYYLKKNMVYNLRGTKYSIPAPKGGRKNNDLILREDQREFELSMKFQRRQKKIDAFDPDY
ncbi:Nin1 binding protein, partial [Mortierella sp. GBA39]